MKKYVLLVSLLLCATATHAQNRLGMKFSPGFAFSRAHTNPNNKGFVGKGSAFGLKIGALYDYCFKDSAYVSTGLFFTSQQLGIRNDDRDGSLQRKVEEMYDLHYVQLPALLKLYTGELTLDTRLYVEIGIIGQLRVNERNTHLRRGQSETFIKEFRRWSIAGQLGVGVEYDINLFTSIFGGISYQLGMANVIKEQQEITDIPPVIGHCDIFSFDLGIRF